MKMKALALGIVMAGSIGFVTTPAPVQAAGIPVIDVANLQQTIAQYMNMIQQLKNLESQLTQAKQQYESITGSRGMGNLARTAESVIPTDWRGTLAQMQGGQIGQLANQIVQEATTLQNPYYEAVDGSVRQSLDGSLRDAANAQARNATVFDHTRERQNRLNTLANAINGASDLKGITDLIARAQTEQGMLINELLRLQSMNAMVQNQREVRASSSLRQEATMFSGHRGNNR